MKVEDVCVSTMPPKPTHFEPGALNNLDSQIFEIAIQDVLVRVEVVARKVGEARSGHSSLKGCLKFSMAARGSQSPQFVRSGDRAPLRCVRLDASFQRMP